MSRAARRMPIAGDFLDLESFAGGGPVVFILPVLGGASRRWRRGVQAGPEGEVRATVAALRPGPRRARRRPSAAWRPVGPATGLGSRLAGILATGLAGRPDPNSLWLGHARHANPSQSMPMLMNLKGIGQGEELT